MWSDGVPFTADDVAYTYNALNALGPKVKWAPTWLRYSTRPWKVVYSDPSQKVFDLRDHWWGDGIVADMPKVQRVIYLPDPGEQNLAQGMISNAFDIVTGIQPTTFPTVFAQNPKVTTWTGQNPPFGYQDWWPHSLYVNTKPVQQLILTCAGRSARTSIAIRSSTSPGTARPAPLRCRSRTPRRDADLLRRQPETCSSSTTRSSTTQPRATRFCNRRA